MSPLPRKPGKKQLHVTGILLFQSFLVNLCEFHVAIEALFCAYRNYMNDSLRTNVFVRFSPETIACGCIYMAARQLKVCGGLCVQCEMSSYQKFYLEGGGHRD